MEDFITLEISEDSSVPKYKQIFNSIINKIETGHIKYGQKLPSINRLSFDYYLARDTVEKAYVALKDRGVIESVKGKGYYVINSAPESQIKVLVLFNKLSEYKKEIFNIMAMELKDKVNIDFFIYHCDFEYYSKVINEHLEGYSYYVIMPHFKDLDMNAFKVLMKKIPREKIIVLDHQVEGYEHYFSCVYQDFKMDLYDAMVMADEELTAYRKLILVFPQNDDYPYPKEIILGFRRYCGFNNISHEIVNKITPQHEIKAGTAYVIIDEHDLVGLIKLQRAAGLSIKKDIGILSYNDTALKEVLANGISVLTTDFKQMGELAAKSIMENVSIDHKNDFKYVNRNSL
ncbi:MAG: GntR family transcriptional regulator [Cyclobacteriaceae bacterium]